MCCAQAGDRTYLRFVPWEPDSPIVSELGTCLRLVECEQSPHFLDASLADGAYQAWQRARRSIHDSWMTESDPANLQP